MASNQAFRESSLSSSENRLTLAFVRIVLYLPESSLMTTTEMIFESSVHSPLNHLTRMEGREYFIELSRHERFTLYRLHEILTF
jgi:hypothetical protein